MATIASGIAGLQLVAGDLLADEAVVWQVVVEGPDDVVAVAVGLGAEVVGAEAGGVGEADQIEPVAGPAFAEAGRGQEPIDNALVGQG